MNLHADHKMPENGFFPNRIRLSKNILDDREGVTIIEVLMSVTIGFTLLVMVYASFLFAWKEHEQWQKRTIDLTHEHRVSDALKWDLWSSGEIGVEEDHVMLWIVDRSIEFKRSDEVWERNGRFFYPDTMLFFTASRSGTAFGPNISGIGISVMNNSRNNPRSVIIYPRKTLDWKPIR